VAYVTQIESSAKVRIGARRQLSVRSVRAGMLARPGAAVPAVMVVEVVVVEVVVVERVIGERRRGSPGEQGCRGGSVRG
jgi:hypothetical protein